LDKIIVQCDPDLEELIPGYMSNRNKDIIAIRACLATGDFEKIRTLGHSMKGSGGGYGFDAITDLGDRIENAALASDTSEIDQTIQKLEDYVNRVEVVYS
jgi:HPt (histidine-containing phosphotransfer) domain-containing protein